MGCWVYPRFLYSIVSFFLGTYDSYELDIAFGLPFGWFFFFLRCADVRSGHGFKDTVWNGIWLTPINAIATIASTRFLTGYLRPVRTNIYHIWRYQCSCLNIRNNLMYIDGV